VNSGLEKIGKKGKALHLARIMGNRNRIARASRLVQPVAVNEEG
jgi:hypothetical protein